MIDTDLIAEHLEQARADRDRIDVLIEWLETSPLLTAAPVEEPPPPSKSRAPRSLPPARRSSVGSRDADARVLGVVLGRNGKMSKAEIAEKSGLSRNQLNAAMKRLLAAGTLNAEGATVKRRYWKGDAPPVHSEQRGRQDATRESNAAKQDAAIARVGLRDRVLRSVAAEPLTEDQLATTLFVGREDIADACGWLLERNRVHLNPDGTYIRPAVTA